MTTYDNTTDTDTKSNEWEEFYQARADECGDDWMVELPHLSAEQFHLIHFLNRMEKIGENASDTSVATVMSRARSAVIIGPEYPPIKLDHRAASIIEWATGVLDRMAAGALYSDGDLLRDVKESQARAVEAALYDLGGLDAWEPASANGPVLWGDASKALALSHGRPTLIYGNDGSGKTTLGGLIAAGALGLPGYGDLLGFTVTPIPETESVLILAFDGHLETVANYRRMGLSKSTERLTLFGGAVPWNPDEADALTLSAFVESIEKRKGARYGVVIIDNAQRAYGGVDRTDRAAVLGNAVNQLEAQGRAVIVFAQSKKNAKPTTKDDAMLGSLGLSGMGSIVSLYRTRQGDAEKGQPTVSELRHHKGIGSDDNAPVTIYFDLITGSAMTSDDGPTESQAIRLATWSEARPLHTSNELAELWEVSAKRARAVVAELVKGGFIEGATLPGQRKVKGYRKVSK